MDEQQEQTMPEALLGFAGKLQRHAHRIANSESLALAEMESDMRWAARLMSVAARAAQVQRPPDDYAEFQAWAKPFLWSSEPAAMTLAWLVWQAALAHRPQEQQAAPRTPRECSEEIGRLQARIHALTLRITGDPVGGIGLSAVAQHYKETGNPFALATLAGADMAAEEIAARPPEEQADRGAVPAVFRPHWPQALRARETYRVPCDDKGRNGGSWLALTISDDGDVWVGMQDWEDIPNGHPNPLPSIRIRTLMGGGQRLRTRQALLWLAEAIRLDTAGETR